MSEIIFIDVTGGIVIGLLEAFVVKQVINKSRTYHLVRSRLAKIPRLYDMRLERLRASDDVFVSGKLEFLE